MALTHIINTSLHTGTFPTAFKLAQNNLLDNNQSGLKSGHSTETALLSVIEALSMARAASKSSVLILLDLSAAFDTVNHQILLSIDRDEGHLGNRTPKVQVLPLSLMISACLTGISGWMKDHHLQLKLAKTCCLWSRTTQHYTTTSPFS
ncbi:uncharacterized protein LOC143721925 [Siphateles boraxobius]|uniref:uncharacterized protein LOC143721925 n=1 Tax=Siphateles boraxobius TaxID=180520 RepID=UPI00406443C0